MHIPVLAIGLPMLLGPSAVICRAVDQIVVSVGRMFQAAAGPDDARPQRLLSASPPQQSARPPRCSARAEQHAQVRVACLIVGLLSGSR